MNTFPHLLRCTAFVYCLVTASQATADDLPTGSIAAEESFVFSSRMSVDEGCQLAEQALRRQAVARQCGSQVMGGALRAVSDSTDALYRLHFETVGGRLVDYAITSRQVTPIEGEALLLRCTVQARARVRCDQGQRDPGFIPVPEQAVKLNETVFRDGEAMTLAIDLPADMKGTAHVAIVQLLPYWEDDKRVWRLYPNAHQPDVGLTAGERLVLPSAAYSLTPTVPSGRKNVEESLMIIFSRQPMALPETMTIEQFHRILAELPLDERREMVIGYRIEAKARN